MPNDQTCLPNRAATGTPCAPHNVFIELNMHFAARRVGIILSPSDMMWFYNQVRNKGPWDFKQMGPEYTDFGNFHYGAVGRAIGVPEQVLLRAAGWAQSRAGTTLNSFGHWTKDAPYGDDPDDQIHIRNGIDFAKRKGY
jgi:hypothetical protein